MVAVNRNSQLSGEAVNVNEPTHLITRIASYFTSTLILLIEFLSFIDQNFSLYVQFGDCMELASPMLYFKGYACTARSVRTAEIKYARCSVIGQFIA